MTDTYEHELFEEAIAKLGERTVVGSPLKSREWREQVATALRERAFFSSTVENARVLQSMRDYISDFLHKNVDPETGGLKAGGRAEFVAEMRELCEREGLGKLDPETGEIKEQINDKDMTELRSMARLQLIFDTQVQSAQEYGYWSQGQDADILYAYPAQRFFRVRPVVAPRDYHQRNNGAVRRKDDLDFWLDMNRDFGVPWGPWGFQSGMGTADVDREEAEMLKLVKPGEGAKPQTKAWNDKLSAGVRDLDPEMRHSLWEAFQGQVEIKNGRAWWAGDTVGKDQANRGMKPTAEMRKIIEEYTRSGEDGEWFGRMNTELRSGEASPEMQEKAGALREALAALPDVRGTFWRDTTEIGEKGARYRVGQNVIENFFISTSKAEDLDFGSTGVGVRWKIETLTGKNVAEFSLKPHQQEVLIPMKRVFRVLDKGLLDDGRTFIHLREEA